MDTLHLDANKMNRKDMVKLVAAITTRKDQMRGVGNNINLDVELRVGGSNDILRVKGEGGWRH